MQSILLTTPITHSEDVADAGTVTVTIAGQNNLSGSVTRTYKINQATLDVYTPSATKACDGTPLADSKDAHVDGLQNGETVDLQVTGSQTEVGFSGNAFNLAWTGTAQEKNYKVVTHPGTLTVTEAPATPEPQKPETPKAEPEQAKVETAKVPDTSDTNA